MSRPHANEPLLVVIDGPAGAGKSTVAARVARALRLPILDTGAIYRTLALEAERHGVGWDDESGLAALAERLALRFEGDPQGGPQRVWSDGDDVSDAIRTAHISDGASRVSAWPKVREALLGLQRALGAHGCVAEGRDMGTKVFPDATYKFFLTADLHTRAERRRQDLVQASAESAPDDRDADLDAVARQLAERDTRDSTRAAAPLVQAADAILVDSTNMDADAVAAYILTRVLPR